MNTSPRDRRRGHRRDCCVCSWHWTLQVDPGSVALSPAVCPRNDRPHMAVPLLGPMTLSGFAHKWFLLFLLVVLGLVGLYIVVQLARQKRMLRFANMELLESVAPKRPTRWRHLPTMLLVRPFYCSPSRWPGRHTTSGSPATAPW